MSRRESFIKIRVSPEELEAITHNAQACGRPVSTYLRELGLNRKPRARPRGIEREAIHQLARAGNNLNQLARAANATRRVELSRRLDQVLREVLAAVRRLA
jgi:hypothetical protein